MQSEAQHQQHDHKFSRDNFQEEFMRTTDHFRCWMSGINAYGVGSIFMPALLLSSIMLLTRPMQAQTYDVLHSFTGAPDGCKPQGDLLRDGVGNLYGTTANCGSSNGVVFKISATGKETILYRFTGKADGGFPEAGLIRDKAGNLYGTAYSGGASGDGVVFELSKGTETVLHSFSGSDGAHPTASLVRDAAGNLYGTTFYGGTASCSCGTVFKIDTAGVETVLYSFTGGTDGKFPAGRLLLDSLGNLYGTANEGGIVKCGRFGMYGCGVVFKVDPIGHETVLYSFTGGADGGQPLAGLIRDSAGNFYGTTFSAGDLSRNCALNNGCGVVFELSKAGQETVLYSFTNGTDGANPTADLVRDLAGNLYGTTKLGGTGYGVVFEIQSGSESALYIFQGTNDGAGPLAGLIRDSSGNLYGTTSFGGSATKGVVFKLTP
jgi:uncharacterized repeat protein (TIGR03803 family)